jgi:hypothetical protein
MFIKIGSLKIESQDAKFSRWMDVLAWSLGGSQGDTAGQVAVWAVARSPSKTSR